MQFTTILPLGFQAIAFTGWAILSFRALFQIRAIAVEQTGSFNPGPFSFLRAMGQWVRDPENKTANIWWLITLAGSILPSLFLPALQSAS